MFSEQKMNYCRFNDVVVFDNAYKTNRFGMPFGIFTGVNNHGFALLVQLCAMKVVRVFFWT
jgi:hypothetical protein